jgi:hypothetical protein
MKAEEKASQDLANIRKKYSILKIDRKAAK